MIKGILILLSLSLNLFSQYPIKVEVEKEDKYIMGVDRIDVKIKLKNISGKELELKGAPGISHWYLKGKQCGEFHSVETAPLLPGDIPIDKSGGANNRIAKDWEKEEIHNILWTNPYAKCKLEKEGVYDFYYVYRDDLEDKDLTERVKVEINYVLPEGIDREAYEYFNGHPLWKPKELLEKFPTSTYAGWALKDYVYKTFDYDEEGRKNEERKYRDLIETFVNTNNDFIFAGSLLSKAAFISLELGEKNKACELFDKSLKLKWQVPTMNNKLKEEAIKRSKSAYEKLKKEGKCK